MIYVIKCFEGRNFVYVETRDEALRICAELPSVFTFEPLNLYRKTDYMESNGHQDQMGHGRQ
jgi:hypothetical protein